MKRLGLLIVLFSVIATAAEAQTVVSGTVTGPEGAPLPYAAVFLKGTGTGTTTNNDGRYKLTVPAGQQTLVFRFVGFSSTERTVTAAGEPIQLDVKLDEQALALSSATITASDEDPAYRVIRNAIRMRPYYRDLVEGYSCDAYIKVVQKITEAPDKVMGYDVNAYGMLDSNNTGIIYLSESKSRFHFEQPDRVKEKMYASKVSGFSQSFSWNRAADLQFSFYNNRITFAGVNDRGFVSPIANKALFDYEYELVGTFMYEGDLINKIKVIPRRRNEPLFAGHIYIVEDKWSLHSVDLGLDKNAQIQFIDSLHLKQTHARVQDSFKQVVSQDVYIEFGVFGIEGNGLFASVYTNFEINPTYKDGFFTNEVMAIQDSANEKSEQYWDTARPVELTTDEALDYLKKDSMENVRTSEAYLDSVDRNLNKFNFLTATINGYYYRKRYTKEGFWFTPFIELLQYNTVEGWLLEGGLRYRRDFEDRSYIRIEPYLRYGFSDDLFSAKVRGLYYYNQKKFAYMEINTGRYVSQFNPEEPIRPYMNALYTLLGEYNYMKLYRNTFLNAAHRSEVMNGLWLRAEVGYSDRSALTNTSDQKWINHDGRDYTANNPEVASDRIPDFADNQAFTLGLSLRLQIGQKYMTRPDMKIIVDESKYPELNVSYRKGLNSILGSDVNYDLISVNVNDNIKLGMFGQAVFSVTAGYFVNNQQLFFQDYKHFYTNRTILFRGETNSFQLLDYYRYSTAGHYTEGHYEHHFNGLLLNKIPLLRRLKWQLVGGTHVLYTDELNGYAEFSIGIENLFNIARADYFLGTGPQSFWNGFRIGIELF